MLGAIYKNNLWALEWEYSGLLHEEPKNDKDVEETVKILSMWEHLESSYEKLHKNDKTKLDSEIEPYRVRFLGLL